MADITLVELHLEKGSFSANLPFSSAGKATGEASESDEDDAAAVDDEESGGRGKGTAAVGVLVLLILGAAAVRYLTGDDGDHEVAIETDEDGPVGVTVDAEDE